MISNNGDEKKTVGILFGLILALVWYFGLAHLETLVGYHQNIFLNPVLVWINLGPIPVFIAAGMYYCRKSGGDDVKQHRWSTELKWIVVAFVIWIFVLILLQLSNVYNYTYAAIGGYLLMLVLMLAFQRLCKVRGR